MAKAGFSMLERRIIIFERCYGWAFWFLIWNIILGRRAYVVDPYWAYHHVRTPIRGFPHSLPAFVKIMVKTGWVKVLTVEELGCRRHIIEATEQAVRYCEKAGDVFQAEVRNKDFLSFYKAILGDAVVERTIKKSVCNALAEFLSVRLLLKALRKCFGSKEFMFIPAYNARQYLFFEKIWPKLEPDHPEAAFRFSRLTLWFDTVAFGFILCMDIGRGLVKAFILFANRICRRGLVPRDAVCGVSLVSLARQIGDAQKSLSFLVDGALIRREDTIIFNYAKCGPRKKAFLSRKFPNIVHMQDAGISWSDFLTCLNGARSALRGFSLGVGIVYKDLSLVMENYFVWKQIGERIRLRNFVTHCDFGASQLGRNLALREKGVRTWLFMDSANQSCNFMTDNNVMGAQHPFWCYLDYDHFVAWTPFLAQYFASHPGSAKQFHVTGCFWADYIQPRRDAFKALSMGLQERLKRKKVVAAFDSTYSRKGMTSYQEGIAFARHILALADLSDDLLILWREKITRKLHYKLDDMSADELLAVYAKMDAHPRIINVTRTLTAGDMIAVSDLVISFPFTSTSLEALSAHRRAIWHDPLAFYRRNIYDDRLVTHGWNELQDLVVRLLRGEELSFGEAESKVRDPYSDGHATNRFRRLLLQSERD